MTGIDTFGPPRLTSFDGALVNLVALVLMPCASTNATTDNYVALIREVLPDASRAHPVTERLAAAAEDLVTAWEGRHRSRGLGWARACLDAATAVEPILRMRAVAAVRKGDS